MKKRIVSILPGGGGSPEQVVATPYLSSRTSFGICQTPPEESNAGQMLKQVQHDIKGFTMAEILLSLTIIGVVAAITLPSLTGNINERTWNTQRKALYARFSQAIALMPALNGYGTLTEGDSSTSAVDTAAETFVTDGLSKVLKINNICDSEHLQDCGVNASYHDMLGSKISMPTTLYELSSYFAGLDYMGVSYSTKNSKALAFETANGESIVTFYNKLCPLQPTKYRAAEDSYFAFMFAGKNMCVNFIYDLNGIKGPNTVGKDIGFITVFNAVDPTVVAPMPFSTMEASASTENCKQIDDKVRIPNNEELAAMLINEKLITRSGIYLSSSPYVDSADRFWGGDNGMLLPYAKAHLKIRCIKR